MSKQEELAEKQLAKKIRKRDRNDIQLGKIQEIIVSRQRRGLELQRPSTSCGIWRSYSNFSELPCLPFHTVGMGVPSELLLEIKDDLCQNGQVFAHK